MSQDAYDMLKRIRMDLSAAQAKITDLARILNEHNLKDGTRPTCPTCGLSLKNNLMLDEHLYHAHDGPEPPHWRRAEEMSADSIDQQEAA